MALVLVEGDIEGQGAGTAFKISGDNFVSLYSFCTLDGCADAEYPVGVIVNSSGALFGTTSIGGTGPRNLEGVAFELTP